MNRDLDLNSFLCLTWIYTFTRGKEAPHYAILDDKGSTFKNYMKKNYNIEFITHPAPGGDHSELPGLLKLL